MAVDSILEDLKTPGNPFYHCSPTQFDHFDFNKIITLRPERDTHDNSVLGLWGSTFPDSCSSFGPFVYEFSLSPSAVVKGIGYKDFHSLCQNKSIADFVNLRESFKNIDMLCVIDHYPHYGEVIVLNNDCLQYFKEISNPPKDHYILIQR